MPMFGVRTCRPDMRTMTILITTPSSEVNLATMMGPGDPSERGGSAIGVVALVLIIALICVFVL